MILAIYKCKEFKGGREMGDRSYHWQVAGLSNGVLGATVLYSCLLSAHS